MKAKTMVKKSVNKALKRLKADLKVAAADLDDVVEDFANEPMYALGDTLEDTVYSAVKEETLRLVIALLRNDNNLDHTIRTLEASIPEHYTSQEGGILAPTIALAKIRVLNEVLKVLKAVREDV